MEVAFCLPEYFQVVLNLHLKPESYLESKIPINFPALNLYLTMVTWPLYFFLL